VSTDRSNAQETETPQGHDKSNVREKSDVKNKTTTQKNADKSTSKSSANDKDKQAVKSTGSEQKDPVETVE